MTLYELSQLPEGTPVWVSYTKGRGSVTPAEWKGLRQAGAGLSFAAQTTRGEHDPDDIHATKEAAVEHVRAELRRAADLAVKWADQWDAGHPKGSSRKPKRK